MRRTPASAGLAHHGVPVLHGAAALAYADILWLLGCVPVVTAPAATSALYRSVDAWVTDGETPTVRGFLTLLRRDFWRALGTAAVLIVIAGVLVADLYAIGRMDALRRPMLVGWLAVTVTLLLLSALVLPALATGERGVVTVFRSALAAALRRPAAAVCAVAAGAAAVLVVVASPISLLAVGAAWVWLQRRLWLWATAGTDTGTGTRTGTDTRTDQEIA